MWFGCVVTYKNGLDGNLDLIEHASYQTATSVGTNCRLTTVLSETNPSQESRGMGRWALQYVLWRSLLLESLCCLAPEVP